MPLGLIEQQREITMKIGIIGAMEQEVAILKESTNRLPNSQ